MGKDGEARAYFSEALQVVESHLGREARLYELVAANAADHAASEGHWARVGELLDSMKKSRAGRGTNDDSADMFLLRATRSWAKGDRRESREKLDRALSLYRSSKRPMMEELVTLLGLAQDATGGPVESPHIEESVARLSELTSDVEVGLMTRFLAADAALLGEHHDLSARMIGEAEALVARLDLVSPADMAQLALLRGRLQLSGGKRELALKSLAEVDKRLEGRPPTHPLAKSAAVLAAELGHKPAPAGLTRPDLVERLARSKTAPPVD
jgi:hypothetical protein